MLLQQGTPRYLLSDEQQEIARLESETARLNAELAEQKAAAKLDLAAERDKHASLVASGRKLERERIAKICRLPEYRGREDAALKMALTDVPTATPEAIASLLRNIPKQERGVDQFSLYMAKLGNPDIGPDRGDEERFDPVSAGWNAAFSKATAHRGGRTNDRD